MALSYDPVEVLASFADEQHITYPLLSDVGSGVIRRLGLENELVEAQNAHFGRPTKDHHRGLPHPGVFHLDADGVVTDKHFEENYRLRPSSAVLFTDDVDDAEAEVIERADVDGVGVEARMLSATYHPNQYQRLTVRLSIPADRHVYVEPTPDGFTGLGVQLSGPASLVADAVQLPAGAPHRVEGLDEEFAVISGFHELTVPFLIAEDDGDVELTVEVPLQSCTDTVCFPPTTAELTVVLHSGGVLRP